MIFFSPRLICEAPASPGFEIFCKKKLKKWLVPDSGARMGLGRRTPAPTGSSRPNFQHPEGVGQPGAVKPPARGVNQHFPIATTALRTPQHPGSLPCPIPAWSCMKPLRCDQNPQTKRCSPRPRLISLPEPVFWFRTSKYFPGRRSGFDFPGDAWLETKGIKGPWRK